MNPFFFYFSIIKILGLLKLRGLILQINASIFFMQLIHAQDDLPFLSYNSAHAAFTAPHLKVWQIRTTIPRECLFSVANQIEALSVYVNPWSIAHLVCRKSCNQVL